MEVRSNEGLGVCVSKLTKQEISEVSWQFVYRGLQRDVDWSVGARLIELCLGRILKEAVSGGV